MSGFLEPLDSQEEAEQLAAALAASVTLQTGVGPAVGPAPEVQTASEASSEDEASDGSADVWVVVSAGASAGSSAAEEPAERPTLRGALAAGEAFVATEESARGLPSTRSGLHLGLTNRLLVCTSRPAARVGTSLFVFCHEVATLTLTGRDSGVTRALRRRISRTSGRVWAVRTSCQEQRFGGRRWVGRVISSGL